MNHIHFPIETPYSLCTYQFLGELSMINLYEASENPINNVGKKAYNLSLLMRNEMNVKEGRVLTAQDISSGFLLDSSNLLDSLKNDVYAVRSSGIGEDSREFSWAGQFLTLLNIKKEYLSDAIARVIYHSHSSSGLRLYSRFASNQPSHDTSPTLAVIIQEMVIPLYSGVIFTRNPVDGSNHLIIEVVKGFGESLASGRKTPKRYIYDYFSQRFIETKPNGIQLDEPTLRELLNVANSIKHIFQCDQDIEFSIEASTGKLFINQARPVTTRRIDDRQPSQSDSQQEIRGGIAASAGLVRGQVVMAQTAHDKQAMDLLSRDTVLVTKFTDPEFIPMLLKLMNGGALVTEVGGMLSHAAIVARELGITAVVGVPQITEILRTGQLVEVDGDRGHIRVLN
ncbi:PEP/pyruvate-binding domain-containing protein [Microcoleus sp. T3_D1]